MAIDPNIAMSFRQPEMPDPLNSFAKFTAIQNAQNQNALAQYQLSAAQRQDQEANALRQALPVDFDIKNPAHVNAILRASPVAGAALLEKLSKVGKEQIDADKTFSDAVTSRIASSRTQLEGVTTPEQYAAWHLQNHRDPVLGKWLASRGVTAGQSLKLLEEALQIPNGFQQLLLASKLGSEKALEQHIQQVNTGQQTFTQTSPKYGGGPASVVPGSVVQMQKSPHEITQEEIARGNLDVSRGQLAETQRQHAWERNKPTWDETAGGYRFPPTKDNPTGTFLAAPEINRSKEQQNAISALRTAGYDPETGDDRIEQLIRKSTSGRLESFSAEAAAWLGNTTEGRKAIGALATRANKIALDMLGGKLGAQISNTDREFIVQTLGDVANDKLPSEQRLASWQEAKNRMMSSGLIPPPKQGRTVGGKITNVTPPPQGIPQAEWNVMTPEEKALWTKQP